MKREGPKSLIHSEFSLAVKEKKVCVAKKKTTVYIKTHTEEIRLRMRDAEHKENKVRK